MKKILSVLTLVLSVILVFPIAVFAAENTSESKETETKPVGVIVETVEEEYLPLKYDYSKPRVSMFSSVVSLAGGGKPFDVGTLSTNATYVTDTYSITKGTIKVGFQSVTAPSSHLKVTLCKSSGYSVAAKTISVPWSNIASGSYTTYISFTNLDTASNYYVVVQNMDTVQTGYIFGIAMQQ